MKPPSIKDIAQALGISIGTVDRALHGRSDVSPKTRARVLKKAEQIGYRPNIAARSLKLILLRSAALRCSRSRVRSDRRESGARLQNISQA
jgi:DNA-binding LacI/PurR family transcriptional regulator